MEPFTQITIRGAMLEELPALSDLCLRSKAVWGYDAAFMEACQAELTLRPQELETTAIGVACEKAQLVGVAQVSVERSTAELCKLFVEPSRLRSGVGRQLMEWAITQAKRRGAERMTIDADPGAAPFYRRMGAVDAGQVPSGSIPGRMLPRLVVDLRR